MSIKSIIFFMTCLFLLSSVTSPVRACPPPDCGDCKEWDPVQEKCVWKEGAECEDSLDCKTCYYCINCQCELPYGSECGEDDPCPGECHTCVGSEICLCEDDDSNCSTVIYCEECNNGICEDRCTPLGKYCNGAGECVECTRNEHCNNICLHCFGGKCIHNCTYCYPPWYCANACHCTDCSTNEDDNCAKSRDKDHECPGCTIDIIYPCSTFSMRAHTDDNRITCTSSKLDCIPQTDPLCYTEYKCGKDTQIWYICETDENGPMGLACHSDISSTFVCARCIQDPGDPGEPEYTEQRLCPDEEWP